MTQSVELAENTFFSVTLYNFQKVCVGWGGGWGWGAEGPPAPPPPWALIVHTNGSDSC